MNLSLEEKAYLIDEINKQTDNRPLFYLKFCKEIKFAQDVCDGNLFGNTAEHFRKLEEKSRKRGQGDKFETILNFQTDNITVMDRKTNEVLLIAPKGYFSVQYGVDKVIPIVSFVGIPFEQMNIIEADETHASFTLPFTEKEYTSMKEEFGQYCVIISGGELETKIQNYCGLNGYEYIFGKVEYCKQNRIDRIEAFNTGSKTRFLYKNEDLDYQREYRLAVGIEIPDDHFIRIGKISSTFIMKSEELKDLIFKLNYKSIKNS